MNKQVKKNLWRRSLGVIICGFPIFLAIACVVFPTDGNSNFHPVGTIMLAFALLLGLLNFFLSFIRPWLYQRRKSNMIDYRNVSGIPVIGSILTIIGLLFNFGNTFAGIIGLIILVFDTGGAPWFLISTWKDDSFWDEKEEDLEKPEPGA